MIKLLVVYCQDRPAHHASTYNVYPAYKSSRTHGSWEELVIITNTKILPYCSIHRRQGAKPDHFFGPAKHYNQVAKPRPH